MSKDNRSPVCRYNSAVDCWAKTPNCAKCGWNPKVEKKRKKKIDEEHTHVVRVY